MRSPEVDEGGESAFLRRAPSALPPFFFAFAHLAFSTAWLLVGLEPQAYVGFFYHSKMMAPVHLLTLGWISGSILGSLYLIGPIALRARMNETRVDRVGFWMYAIGVVGMVSHFWLDSYSGMTWSALLVISAFSIVGLRCGGMLKRSPAPFGVKLHIGLAFCNISIAVILGLALALSKLGVLPLMGGTPLGRVAAHAHLAALGWATMMFCGVSYRLLPMILPSAVPRSSWIVINATLLEVGVLSLFSSLYLGRRAEIGAVLMAMALVGFAIVVCWMVLNRRRPASGIPKLPTVHIALALSYLGLAISLGLLLIFADLDESLRLRLIPVYGAVLLVGFLGQVINGVSQRIVPLYRWFRRAATSSSQPQPPYSGQSRLSAALLGGWALGVPTVALGLFFESAIVLGIGSWTMFLTALVGFATVRYE